MVCPWTIMVFHEIPWSFHELPSLAFLWITMVVLYELPWSFPELPCISLNYHDFFPELSSLFLELLWFSINCYGFPWTIMVFPRTILVFPWTIMVSSESSGLPLIVIRVIVINYSSLWTFSKMISITAHDSYQRFASWEIWIVVFSIV